LDQFETATKSSPCFLDGVSI